MINKIINFFKKYPVNLFFIKDKEIADNFSNIIDNAEKFANFLVKENVKKVNYTTNNLFKYSSTSRLNYGREENHGDTRRIDLKIEGFGEASIFLGCNSAGGMSLFKKDHIDYDYIIERIFSSIEKDNSHVILSDKHSEYIEHYHYWWDNHIEPIKLKYKCDKVHIRKAIIFFLNEGEEKKCKEIKEELIKHFIAEEIVYKFIKEVEDTYSSKVVLDNLY